MGALFEVDQLRIRPAGVAVLRAALTSRLVQIPGAALIVIGAFFATLWLTGLTPMNAVPQPDTASSESEIDKLAGMHVSTWEDLRESAADVGLVPARSLVGAVDKLTRANDRDVTAAGWLADPHGDGAPMTLIAFLGSKSVAIGKTSSERPDITAALRLTNGAEKNVAFELTFSCETGHLPIIVGVGPERQYRLFELKQVC
jgi:hypothetical protein